MTPRNKIMALLTNIQQEDEAAVMVYDGLKIQEETEIPTGSDFVKAFQVTYDREENTYLKVTLETKKKLYELKWNGGSTALMKWLTEERVMMHIDRWKTARAKTVGFLMHIHPTFTWKPDLQDELRSQLE